MTTLLSWLSVGTLESGLTLVLGLVIEGSPDPDGRQIDGLGGGISSLSKVAVIGEPGEPLSIHPNLSESHNWVTTDGVSWCDDTKRASDPATGWDVVYRFGQVAIREPVVDWGTTCGNLVAAVAQFSVDEGLVNEQISTALTLQRQHDESASSSSLSLTIRILAADTGKIIRATLPIISDSSAHQRWFARAEGETSISGVSGTAAPIVIETPLENEIMPTGNAVDHVVVDGKEISCTIIDAGLPCIFVPVSSLPFPPSDASETHPDLLSMSPADLDSLPGLHAQLESIRHAAARLIPSLSSPTTDISTASPKICLIGPAGTYRSTSGELIANEGSTKMDLRIRAVSVGNFHRTVPATMLSALALARAIPDSLVARTIRESSSESASRSQDAGVVGIRVGQPAGISEAEAVVGPSSGRPSGIRYLRTARRIMSGDVLIPEHVLALP